MYKSIRFKKSLCYPPKRFVIKQIREFSSCNKKDDNSISVDPKVDATKPIAEPSKEQKDSLNTLQVSRILKDATTFQGANDTGWVTTPYSKQISNYYKMKAKTDIKPKSASVILFPGQGIIKVGMIKKYLDFPNTKELFEIANEIVNMDLLKLCLNGPQEKLDRTEFNQAATVILSLAALDKLEKDHPTVFETCAVAAGYSVGEITSLIFSGVLTFEDGIRLVWARGKAMQKASDIIRQGMLSVTCTHNAQVSEACTDAQNWANDLGVENPVCRVAIYLHTEHKILAGNIEALEYIEKCKEKYGFRTTTRLPVSGAFHTELMEPALKSVYKTLSIMSMNKPRCTIYSNYKGFPYSDLRLMKKYILKQIISPVKWEQCIQHIYSRPDGTAFPQTYDVASGGRMRAVLKLINNKACKSCDVI